MPKLTKLDQLSWSVIVTLMFTSVSLHLTSELRADSLHGGTTLVLIASEKAAVITSDSYQHESNSGLSSQRPKKVHKVKDSVLVAVSGACAFHSADGLGDIDLQLMLPPMAAELKWEDPVSDARSFQTQVRTALGKLEQKRISGAIDNSINPRVDILLAGCSAEGRIFAFCLKCPGQYLQEGSKYRIQFDKIEHVTRSINPGKAVFVASSHSEEIQKRAYDLAAGRSVVPTNYPGLRAFRNPSSSFDESTLRAAARDSVQFTIDEDPTIGGTIQIESVSARPSVQKIQPAGDSVQPKP
jgi:hypothetical protein